MKTQTLVIPDQTGEFKKHWPVGDILNIANGIINPAFFSTQNDPVKVSVHHSRAETFELCNQPKARMREWGLDKWKLKALLWIRVHIVKFSNKVLSLKCKKQNQNTNNTNSNNLKKTQGFLLVVNSYWCRIYHYFKRKLSDFIFEV